MPMPPPGDGSSADEHAALRQPPQRLHPFSIIRGFQLRSLLGLIPALLVFGSNPDVTGVALLTGTAVIAVIVGVVRVLGWQRHTYEFGGGRIIEKSGIVSRQERALEVERIQQVDVDRTILDRLVGTCELRMETAADSGDSELTLRVVTEAEADRLRDLLARRIGAETARPAADGDGPATPAAVTPPEELVSVPLPRVALAAVTGPRLLAVPAAIAAVFGLVAEAVAPDEIVDTAGDAVAGLSVGVAVVVFIALVVGSILIAGIAGIIRDGGFTMALRGDDLLVRRGLTTTRSATVPMRRVQRVTVRRRWLQQALGYASVTVHSAGGAGGGDSSQQLDRSLTVPLLPEADVDALVHRLLRVDSSPPLRPHPPQARRRAVVRGLLGMLPLALLLAGLAVVLGVPVLGAGPLVLLAAGSVGGYLAYDKLASGADEHVVVGRTGLFGTTTELSPLHKTQGTNVKSSFFQRRMGLASLHVHVAGPAGGITLQDLGGQTAHRLAPTLID